MTNPKKFFSENVERHATSQQRPIEYNEQRGFLAMCEAIEQLQTQLSHVSQELQALRREIHTR